MSLVDDIHLLENTTISFSLLLNSTEAWVGPEGFVNSQRLENPGGIMLGSVVAEDALMLNSLRPSDACMRR